MGHRGLDFREASNKIIHALDFRPTCDTADGSREGKWAMSGMIELQGAEYGKEWWVTMYPFNYLEAMLELVEYKPPAPPRNILSKE